MFCTKCGTPNLDDALSCVSCGQPLKKKVDAKPKPQLATPSAPSSKAPVPPPPEFPAPAPKLSYEPVPKPPAELLHEKKETPLVPGEVPPEIKGFNLGALVFGFIWAFVHNLWIWGILMLVLSFIPIANLVSLGIGIYLAVKGNELAWKAKHFESVKQFKDTQRIWSIVSIPFVALYISGIVLLILLVFYFNKNERKIDYDKCVNMLLFVKDAEESYAMNNGVYTDDPGSLAMYAFEECEDPTGTNCYRIADRVSRGCDADSFSIEINDDGSDYWIKDVTQGSSKCKICVTTRGYAPITDNGCKRQMDFQCP